MRFRMFLLLPLCMLLLKVYNVYRKSILIAITASHVKKINNFYDSLVTSTEAITPERHPLPWLQGNESQYQLNFIPTFYNYSIVNQDICHGDVFMLVVVFTVASHTKERHTIRKTWGNISSISDAVLVFLVGNHANQPSLFEESNLYKDIIEASFVDNYSNLTLKSIAMLEIANTFCKGVKYLMKIDEDVFMKIPVMFTLLKEKMPENSILGYRILNRKPMRGNPHHKWSVSYSEYSPEYWPTYVNGPSYVISGDIIVKLLQAALLLPHVHIEDAFITGICRDKKGAEIIDIGHMISLEGTYTFQTWKLCDRMPIAIHKLYHNDLEYIWNKMKKNCTKDEHGLQ